jgi:chromosome segregation ATPase
MATLKELHEAIREKQAELQDLQSDLPKLRRLAAEATAEAANALRTLPLSKRMDLHNRRSQIAAIANEQEDAVEDVRAAIEELQMELEAAQEEERIEKVILWARQRNAEAARAFATALKPLREAQAGFDEVYRTLQREISAAGGMGSERGAKLSMPTHAFTRMYVQLPPSPYGSGRMPLDKYLERLRMHQSGAFKGK